MKFAVVTSATYLILPQYILGLVLLAPPGTHYKEEGNDNLELIDLDDSLTQLSWTVPMSNLERAVLPLDDEDGTLTKDLLSLRRGKSRPKNSLRSLNSHRHEILKNNSDLFSDVGHSLEQAGDSSTRQISHVNSRSGSIPDARGPQLSHLVETVTQSLRGRIELRANGSIDTPLRTKHRRVPGRVQPDSSNDSSKSSTSQKQSSVSQGEDVLSQGRRSHVHNMTQSDSSASHRSRRWAPIKMSHQIKIGPGPSRPLIIRKRQRVSAKVGVLVVVDNSIFRQYLLDNGGDHKVALARIRRYYGMVFAMIDQRYATITDPDLSISVKISGILVAERREDSGWLEQLVDWGTVPTHGMASIYTDRALKKFTKWLGGRRHLPEFDHAMIFTAYRLTIKQGIGLGGMAYLNAVCQTSSSVSIVADRGDFQCVKVATHELAHSLGANHDGDKQSKSCPPSGNYVMSPQPSHERHVLRNAFYFSPCSVRDMLIHLSKSSSACVNDDPPVYYSYELKRLPPGHLYTADMQCKLIFGKKSAFCTDGNVQDVMCGQLWCKDPHKVSGCRTNSYLTALPGTECGVNRICHLGECILDPAKNAINSPVPQIRIIPSRQRNNEVPSYRMKGPAATQKAQEKRNRTSARQDRCRGDKNDVYCQGLLQVNPGGCRRRAVRQYCCQTCNRYSPN